MRNLISKDLVDIIFIIFKWNLKGKKNLIKKMNKKKKSHSI